MQDEAEFWTFTLYNTEMPCRINSLILSRFNALVLNRKPAFSRQLKALEIYPAREIVYSLGETKSISKE